MVEGIVVSHDSKMFATRDTSNGVCLFKWDYKYGDTWDPVEWIFSGKMQSHEIAITGICFGESLDENEQNKIWLFSIGRDWWLYEYDVKESSEEKGLKIAATFKIERESSPTACIWYPKTESKEDLLLTVNDDYKMKIWNIADWAISSWKTVLGPTYGGEICKVKRLDIEGN